jgi:aminopeptidase C
MVRGIARNGKTARTKTENLIIDNLGNRGQVVLYKKWFSESRFNLILDKKSWNQ